MTASWSENQCVRLRDIGNLRGLAPRATAGREKDEADDDQMVHGMRTPPTTQAQRPGPRDATIATVMRWPG